jgi:hypothetical protein
MFKTFEAYNNNKQEELKSKLDKFIKKQYDETNLEGKDINVKLYDFFMSHDIEIGDLYYYLKKMDSNIESIEFLKPSLIIKFKEENVILELNANFSHYVNKEPIFYWKLSTSELKKLKNNIEIENSDKANFFNITNTDTYEWFLKYGFKNQSNNEDEIKKRIKISKNNYTYTIESNGNIYRHFSINSKNTYTLLNECGYLETVEEYNTALKIALDNYKNNRIYFK